ncbi:flavodoxin family protein [Candidatus Dojkabacteria bacterium]|nr:flavodoxin family protein [Candidatus Dojkabacteria bacterium]
MKVLSVCGSPRKGNSEAILKRLQKLLEEKGAENEIILLRNKEINRCLGCVEYCNHKLKCQIKDSMQAIMEKMEQADAFIFISPNYFKMPTGLFKDFIDRCSIFFTAGKENIFKKKKAIVISVGTDSIENIDVCLNNIADNFCSTIGLPVVAKKSFRSRSELKGNYEDIFDKELNPTINKDLKELVKKLCSGME